MYDKNSFIWLVRALPIKYCYICYI